MKLPRVIASFVLMLFALLVFAGSGDLNHSSGYTVEKADSHATFVKSGKGLASFVTINSNLQPIIPLVSCQKGAGSAFYIGPNILLSVDHVTSLGECTINGLPIKIIWSSKDLDLSVIYSDAGSKDFFPIDCDGFIADKRYISIGHARALDELSLVPLNGEGKYSGGLAMLDGVFEAQPGMSGGPIIDADTLRVVGTTNTADWEMGITGSSELKGSPLCHHS